MITIRKSGGASVVALPKAILNAMNLSDGSQLSYTIENGAIVLRPVHSSSPTLEELFDGVADGEYSMTEKEREEFEIYPVGKENL